jgi:hypothetical protein
MKIFPASASTTCIPFDAFTRIPSITSLLLHHDSYFSAVPAEEKCLDSDTKTLRVNMDVVKQIMEELRSVDVGR